VALSLLVAALVSARSSTRRDAMLAAPRSQ